MVPQDLQPGSTIPHIQGSSATSMLFRASPAQPLPSALLDEMQNLFQADFSAVRIHNSPQAYPNLKSLFPTVDVEPSQGSQDSGTETDESDTDESEGEKES